MRAWRGAESWFKKGLRMTSVIATTLPNGSQVSTIDQAIGVVNSKPENSKYKDSYPSLKGFGRHFPPQ